MKRIVWLSLLWCQWFLVEAQPAVSEYQESNVILQSEKLNPFFESLHALTQNQPGIVNILHIGDSHLQADFLTHTIRKKFQYRFGNAGRGLLVPYRVARTNEPYTYQTSSDAVWESKRCVFPEQPLPIGIGGVTIRTTQPGKQLSVRIRSDSSLAYQFRQMKLFCIRDSSSFDFIIRDTEGAVLAESKTQDTEQPQQPVYIALEDLADNFSIETVQSNPGQQSATIFGFSLENGEPGVLYHTVGVNGAQYTHYTQAQYFAEQTAGLQPRLVVLSLGTNEAHNGSLTMTDFYTNIDQMVQALQRTNPDAVILLTTPAASFRRRVPNTKITEIRQTILAYAQDHQLPCWDLNGITGDAAFWRTNKLILSDGVHYTRKGYEFQGELLFQALMRSFDHYVSDRL